MLENMMSTPHRIFSMGNDGIYAIFELYMIGGNTVVGHATYFTQSGNGNVCVRITIWLMAYLALCFPCLSSSKMGFR